jgi:hypothetical protein
MYDKIIPTIVLCFKKEGGRRKVNGAALILRFWFSSKAHNKNMELESEGKTKQTPWP